jgi:hypothetical protein
VPRTSTGRSRASRGSSTNSRARSKHDFNRASSCSSVAFGKLARSSSSSAPGSRPNVSQQIPCVRRGDRAVRGPRRSVADRGEHRGAGGDRADPVAPGADGDRAVRRAAAAAGRACASRRSGMPRVHDKRRRPA